MRTTEALVALGENDDRWTDWQDLKFHTAYATSNTIAPLNPTNGGQVASVTPALQWSEQDKRVFYYEVMISKDSSFNMDPKTAETPVYWELAHGGLTTKPLNSYQVRNEYKLEPNSTYYWKVRPRIQGDGTPVAWSPVWTFRTP